MGSDARGGRFLFDPRPADWDWDDARADRIAQVVFTEGPTDVYSYRIPSAMFDQVAAGKRLTVPWGRSNRQLVAYCVEVVERADASRQLKDVLNIVDEVSLVSPLMLRLTRWIADYYVAPWGRVLEAVLPAGVRSAAKSRSVTVFHLNAGQPLAGPKLTAKQLAVWELLKLSPEGLTMAEITGRLRCTAAPVLSLRRRQFLRSETRELSKRRELTHESEAPPIDRELNRDQQQAVTAIIAALDGDKSTSFLLHGITGSGKTEVYIRAIEEVLARGRQAIELVPEISLTPQTQSRFRSRFERVAVLHSQLSDAERLAQWQKISQGEIDVVVGARSAVFAPTSRLGLIILDEEHDGSFKQDVIPRYHARDVARQRAELENVPLVLGSATPALESWQRAAEGKMRLISMPRRVLDRPLPRVALVDMRHEVSRHAKPSYLSRQLQQAMRKALDRHEQIILLLNRRGFSTHVQCPACGFVLKCPHCDLALTHHRDLDRTLCHHCDFSTSAPSHCPQCRFEGIRYAGLGTQRLEDIVRRVFPEAPCVRMDSDTMQRPGSHEAALAKFRRGEASILLGTQMIAKGLDFPDVTVVGVINADAALNLPDFRAAERTFQLVTQVAGRTGRGEKGGCVYVQTHQPEHSAIRAAERHDYQQFVEQEIPLRRQFQYPPFTTLVRIIVRGPIDRVVQDAAARLAEQLRELQHLCPDLRMLGPAPAAMPKLRGAYRHHLLLRTADPIPLQQKLKSLVEAWKAPADVLWMVDVDASDML